MPPAPTSSSTIIASVSGGKDSAAMSLWLAEQGIQHERVFFDTGWEHPWTYDYIRGPLTQKLGPIRELRAEACLSAQEICGVLAAIDGLPLVSAEFWNGNPMVVHALKKGMFPAGVKARWCTDLLKRQVALRYFESLIDEQSCDIVNCVGIRSEEGAVRASRQEWEVLAWRRRAGHRYEVDVWRPVLRFTLDDVIAIHRRHDLQPNPLYLQGGIERVGCAPCINERKSGIRALAKLWPERFELIRELEVAVGRLAARRLDGQALHNPDWRPPTWFMASGGGCIPVDQVVRWSRTVRGGTEEDRQELLFARINDGCARWGLCDSGAAGLGTDPIRKQSGAHAQNQTL